MILSNTNSGSSGDSSSSRMSSRSLTNNGKNDDRNVLVTTQFESQHEMRISTTFSMIWFMPSHLGTNTYPAQFTPCKHSNLCALYVYSYNFGIHELISLT